MWEKLKAKFQREPVVIIGAVVAVVQASIGLAVAYGAPLSGDQAAAIVAACAAAGAFIQAIIAREKVTPVDDPRAADGSPLVPAAKRPGA